MLNKDTVRGHIRTLRNENKHSELAEYFITLLKPEEEQEALTVQKLYEYVKTKKVQGKDEYWINADTINHIALKLSAHKQYSSEAERFYKLSGDRESVSGCFNYVLHIVSSNPKKALIYVKIGLKLANPEDLTQFKHFFAAKCFFENKDYSRAFQHYLSAFNVSNSKKELDEHELKRFETILERLKELFLTKDHFDLEIPELQTLAKALYQSSIDFRDKKASYYKQLMNLKAGIVKCYAKILINKPYEKPEPTKPNFILPSGLPLVTSFQTTWALIDTPKDVLTIHHGKRLDDEYTSKKSYLKEILEGQRAELKLVQDILQEDPLTEQLELSYKERIKSLKADIEALEKLIDDFDTYYEQLKSKARVEKRRHEVERTFFNPQRIKNKKTLYKILCKIVDMRFFVADDKDTKAPTLKLDGISTRLTITAERLFQETISQLAGKHIPNLGIPTAREKPWSISYYSRGTTPYGPTEHYEIGNTTVTSEHRVTPKLHRLGDSYLPKGGSYNKSIDPFLKRLTQKDSEKEKALVTLMLNYSRNHTAISLEKLQAIQGELDDEDLALDESDVQTFNEICFLILEKEQMQWHAATNTDFHVGMTVAQARCLKLIQAGVLSFEDTFKNNVLFGVYSKNELYQKFSEVKKACHYIETLYSDYLLNHKFNKALTFKKFFIQEQPLPDIVATRHQMHRDMLDIYGEESDSSCEEDYDSDLEMSEFVLK